jgi:hypothetical protein
VNVYNVERVHGFHRKRSDASTAVAIDESLATIDDGNQVVDHRARASARTHAARS